MSDAQYENYVNELNAFVDMIPVQTKSIRDNLETGRIKNFKKGLFEVCDILEKIHANALAQNRGRIDGLVEESAEDVEAFTEQFILDISTLSIHIQMAAHKTRESEIPAAEKLAFVNANILAVDNSQMFLNTITKLLSGTSYGLTCASSGKEALEFLETNTPDVILLDIEMPEIDGYQLAEIIKERGITAPIIFITAHSEREYIDKAVEAGAVALIMKPLRKNQLLATLIDIV
jgi:CheY-like chemotaxis protein